MVIQPEATSQHGHTARSNKSAWSYSQQQQVSMVIQQGATSQHGHKHFSTKSQKQGCGGGVGVVCACGVVGLGVTATAGF